MADMVKQAALHQNLQDDLEDRLQNEKNQFFDGSAFLTGVKARSWKS